MRFTLVLLAALVGGLCFAGEVPPPGGEPREFHLPATRSLQLDNGLRVTFVPFGNVPKLTIGVMVQSGNLNEGGQIWLADVSGDLMQEGTTTRDALDIARTFADMGGSMGIGVGMERTLIRADGLSQFAPQLFRELAAVIMAPRLPEAELARILADQLRSLSIARTQPSGLAGEAFSAALYGDHAYGRVFPSEAQLAAITIDDVRRYYTSNFGAQRTHVFVAGKFDQAAVERAIRDTLGRWHAGPPAITDTPSMASGPAVRLVDRKGAPQSTIYLGIAAPPPAHDDFIALSVTNTLLGGGLSSRITRNLREDKGYTYSPSSRLVPNPGATFWRQTADVTTAHTGAALREIIKEINNLQNEAPSAEELEGVQNYLAGTFVLRNATRSGLISQLAYLDLHGLPLERLTGYARNVYAVTPNDIQSMARRYLRADRMILVVVGDLDVVRGQLADLPEFQGLFD